MTTANRTLAHVATQRYKDFRSSAFQNDSPPRSIGALVCVPITKTPLAKINQLPHHCFKVVLHVVVALAKIIYSYFLLSDKQPLNISRGNFTVFLCLHNLGHLVNVLLETHL